MGNGESGIVKTQLPTPYSCSATSASPHRRNPLLSVNQQRKQKSRSRSHLKVKILLAIGKHPPKPVEKVGKKCEKRLFVVEKLPEKSSASGQGREEFTPGEPQNLEHLGG
jgi:hypothetical protein